MLGTVISVKGKLDDIPKTNEENENKADVISNTAVSDKADATLIVQIDGEPPRTITINPKEYSALDHGYATTIHKSQGTTVNQTFVLASATMDRHLTYVSMTRHRHEAKLYGDRKALKKLKRSQSISYGSDRAQNSETRNTARQSQRETRTQRSSHHTLQ